jgi:hypothetical protein
MGGPAGVHHVIEQEQSLSLGVLLGFKYYVTVQTTIAFARILGLYSDRAAELFFSGGYIERMDSVK